ncbi:MAG: cell division protein ZapE [Alphaproteobacteria bacterium]|nr:cell division protein ZapE [Alphaproteobacteria bacterium]
MMASETGTTDPENSRANANADNGGNEDNADNADNGGNGGNENNRDNADSSSAPAASGLPLLAHWQADIAANRLQYDPDQLAVVRAFALLAAHVNARASEAEASGSASPSGSQPVLSGSPSRGLSGVLSRWLRKLGKLGKLSKLGELGELGKRREGGRGQSAAVASIRGIYVYGSVGRGKSMIMQRFIDALHIPPQRYHFQAFIQRVHDARAQQAAARAQRARQHAALPLPTEWVPDGTVLCLDEFEITNVVDAMLVERLFRQLWARGVVVVFTTNLAPDDQYRHGLQRVRFLPFIAAVHERCSVVSLVGSHDFRRDPHFAPAHAIAEAADAPTRKASGGQGASVARRYFCLTSSGDNALPKQEVVQAFWALFRREAPQARRCTLPVGGSRSLVIHRAAGRVAMIAYNELFGQPRGRSDYFAIVREYDSVFLLDVPQMAEHMRNEAIRFREFIDVAYDTSTRLSVLGEVPPDSLYLGTSARGAFARTTSRIIAMTA